MAETRICPGFASPQSSRKQTLPFSTSFFGLNMSPALYLLLSIFHIHSSFSVWDQPLLQFTPRLLHPGLNGLLPESKSPILNPPCPCWSVTRVYGAENRGRGRGFGTGSAWISIATWQLTCWETLDFSLSHICKMEIIIPTLRYEI